MSGPDGTICFPLRPGHFSQSEKVEEICAPKSSLKRSSTLEDAVASKQRRQAGDATMNETTLVHDQLLAPKCFVPASSRPLISRPRLITLLNTSLQRKCTLIVASATHTLLWQKGECSMVLRWLQQTPEDSVRARPRLYLFYVRLSLLAASPQVAEPWLQAAEAIQWWRHPTDTKRVMVAGNVPVGQMTGHLSSLGIAVLDWLMRKGEGP